MKKLLILIIILGAGYWLYTNDKDAVSDITDRITSFVAQDENVTGDTETTTTGDTNTVDSNNLYGVWQSSDDENATITFAEDGTFISEYMTTKDTGTWTYDDATAALTTTINDEAYEYTVLALTSDALSLSYTARGNTLNYVRKTGSDLTKDWPVYENTEYGAFAISYAPEWEAQEMLKPRDAEALHEISFHEVEYDMWRGELAMRIYMNDDMLSASQWLDALLENEAAKEAACRAEYGDESPCLYLNNRVTWREGGTIDGVPAEAVAWFSFDHEELCTYVAHDAYIYALCSSDGAENPNDPNYAEHKRITDAMRLSFDLR